MEFDPSLLLFPLPLPSWLQTPSSRVAQYERRKRKKADDCTDTEGDGGETTDAASVEYVAAFSESPILTPNETHQYRVAGLPLDQQLPTGNRFPHGPPKESSEQKPTLEPSLKDLSPWTEPIYYPQATTNAYNGNDLHFQHLIVLTNVLHRCLLDGDFTRAGRAWGLLLREEFEGLPLDMRNYFRWGIGAEILLRQGVENVTLFDNSNEDGCASLPFTKKGAEQAREYYQRLILHHPYSRLAPRSISARHFYPAMFGLWIYVTQEESNVGRNNIEENYENSSAEESDWGDSDSEQRESDKKQALVAAVRAQELQQAQQIAIRMDSILDSPPYSDSPELLQMRGMVSLWIGDLLLSSLASSLGRGSEGDGLSTDAPYDSYGTLREQRLAMERRQVEVDKAKEFLKRANERKKGVAHNLEDLHFGGDSSFGD